MVRKAKPKTYTFSTLVVGMQFQLKVQARGMLARRAPFAVELMRDPTNPEDENCIRVHVAEGPWEGEHLGHVPRLVAAEFAPRMDDGSISIVRATVAKFQRSDHKAPLSIVFQKERK